MATSSSWMLNSAARFVRLSLTCNIKSSLPITSNKLWSIYITLYTTMKDLVTCRVGFISSQVESRTKVKAIKIERLLLMYTFSQWARRLNLKYNLKVYVSRHVCMKFMKITHLVLWSSWQSKGWRSCKSKGWRSCKALWWTVHPYMQDSLSK